MGVDAPAPGRDVFQAMFLLRSHSVGKVFELLVPIRVGPRNSGQSELSSKMEADGCEVLVELFFCGVESVCSAVVLMLAMINGKTSEIRYMIEVNFIFGTSSIWFVCSLIGLSKVNNS